MYLWRRILPDSGGAGKYRGGNSMEIASIVHGVESIDHFAASSAHHALPLSPLFGGYPNDVHRFTMHRGTDVLERMTDGVVPVPGALTGDVEDIPARAFGVPQRTGDVFTLRYCASGGFGDPLQRDPELVADDVRHERISGVAAREIYGVVLDASDDVLEAETERHRSDAREARRAWPGPASNDTAIAGDAERWTVGPGLRVVEHDGDRVLACKECMTVLSPLSGNWKQGALVGELELPRANPLCPDPATLIDDDFVLRQYACPGCARLLDNDVQRRSEPPIWDFRIEERV
jgi:N-methylhydantoinase B